MHDFASEVTNDSKSNLHPSYADKTMTTGKQNHGRSNLSMNYDNQNNENNENNIDKNREEKETQIQPWNTDDEYVEKEHKNSIKYNDKKDETTKKKFENMQKYHTMTVTAATMMRCV